MIPVRVQPPEAGTIVASPLTRPAVRTCSIGLDGSRWRLGVQRSWSDSSGSVAICVRKQISSIKPSGSVRDASPRGPAICCARPAHRTGRGSSPVDPPSRRGRLAGHRPDSLRGFSGHLPDCSWRRFSGCLLPAGAGPSEWNFAGPRIFQWRFRRRRWIRRRFYASRGILSRDEKHTIKNGRLPDQGAAEETLAGGPDCLPRVALDAGKIQVPSGGMRAVFAGRSAARLEPRNRSFIGAGIS